MIKVLVVDDSALMRNIISDMLNSDKDVEVIATAKNGIEAIEKVKKLKPDVVTMDVVMPKMDGLTALKTLMHTSPLPLIVISAHTPKESKKAIEALQAGAIDLISKPSGEIAADIDLIKNEIISKVKIAAVAKVKRFKEVKVKKHKFISTRKKIIVIGSSTGGPQTLEALLTEFPKNIPAAILIVQHMPPVFTKTLAERLNSICEIEVREAKDGDKIKEGVALIAPGNFHMELNQEDGETITINQKPYELGVRPNVNRLFKSVAPIFKDNTIGIVLTGMGKDGQEGSKEIKRYSGTVLAEAEESCIIYGMPKEVIEAGYADEVVPLDRMSVALLQLLDI